MSINYRILKACDFSPRHKSAMIAALNALQRPTVARCAALLHKLCKLNSIADFPNPFPHDEPDHMLWNAIFSGETPLTDAKPEVGVTSPKRAWPAVWEGYKEPEGETEDEKPHSTPPQTGTGEEPLLGVPEDPIDPDAVDKLHARAQAGQAAETKNDIRKAEQELEQGVAEDVGPGAPEDPRDPNVAPEPTPAGIDLGRGTGDEPITGLLEEILGDSTDAGKPPTDPHLDPNDPYYPVANRQVPADETEHDIRRAEEELEQGAAEEAAEATTPADKPEV